MSERESERDPEATRAYVWIALLFVVGASLVKASVHFNDVHDWIVPAARAILDGRPLDIYSVRVPIFDVDVPNSYSPLYYFVVAPFVAVVDALGLPYRGWNAWGASIVGLPWVLGDVLLAGLLCQAAKERMDDRTRVWLFALLLVQPMVWYSSVRIQHHESLLLAVLVGVVLSVEGGRGRRAVGLAALALSLKTTAVLALPPLAAYLWWRGRRSTAVAMLLAPPAALLLLLSPWLLLRQDETVYAMLRFESLRPIFGISLAKLVAGTALADVTVRYSNAVLLALSVAIGVWVVRRGASPRRAVACAYLMALLLSRWVYPHYLLVPCGLLLFWELRQPSFPRVSLLAVSGMWVIQSPWYPEITTEVSGGIRIRAAIWGVFLAALLAWLAARTPRGAAEARPG